MAAALAHINAWIFDLDNTLYPADAGLMQQIDVEIGRFVQRLLQLDPVAARAVQKGFFHSHGTTLAGLMAEYGVDPHDYLAAVHDIDMTAVAPHPELGALIARLPGRKFVFTNADAPYAEKVLARLGLSHAFDAMHDIHALGLVPKPQQAAYDSLCRAHGIDPTRALFVEDMARNLAPAKAMGMTTVWIDNGSEQGPNLLRPGEERGHIDYTIPDLAQWLAGVLAELEQA